MFGPARCRQVGKSTLAKEIIKVHKNAIYLDLIKQSSETLAGRISYIEIGPFVASEVKDLRKLLKWTLMYKLLVTRP